MTDDAALERTVYAFGASGRSYEIPAKDEVGSKARNLIAMSQMGLPVPPGFVLGTRLCREYLDRGSTLSEAHVRLLDEGIRGLQDATGLAFGGDRRPLLVSVRSGAAVSMPGMMDTVLNVGLNDKAVAALVRMTGNPRFAWDSYSRLVQTYSEVVHGCRAEPFAAALGALLRGLGARGAEDLVGQELARVSQTYIDVFEELVGQPFPQEPRQQLLGAVGAVFRSWESPRALEYRRVHQIAGLSGTAVTVQAMVFGNMGPTSGAGVGFTRNPITGDNGLFMDFLFNSQGEDVVSGRQQRNDSERLPSLLPTTYREIQSIGKRLELHFGDMQDFEFTVQQGRLYILQCRTGKRTPWAALRIAVDLVKEGVIDVCTGLDRLIPYDLSSIKNTRLATTDEPPIAVGIPANRGVASGEIALDSEVARSEAAKGKPVILVREETATSDIAGMAVCIGMLTRLGGRTSHAAVVARQLDKVCVVGCGQVSIDYKKRTCSIAGRSFPEGDWISVDGNSGKVYAGRHAVVEERPTSLLKEVEGWRLSDGEAGPSANSKDSGPSHSEARLRSP